MSAQDTNFNLKITDLFSKSSPALVMGILNITNDSFFDGGKYVHENDYLKRVEVMLQEGADIIDIGAQSTRPGAPTIGQTEEERILSDAVKKIRKAFPNILISADTFRAGVAEKVADAGVDIINDISGGTMDEKMIETAGKLTIPYVLMHIKGTPQTMQQQAVYENVTKEVIDFLKLQIEKLKQAGNNQIIIDPGFGFGKTMEHNYQLLNELESFKSIDRPLLVGISRKSMIWKLLDTDPGQALNGTTALNTIALMKGAKILRVHDVKEAKEVVRIFGKMRSCND